MRGTHDRQTSIPIVIGIIPAYAGNTRWRARESCAARDHPRVCGEHGNFDLTGIAGKGSSPRMRGTLVRSERGLDAEGIIPAYAGNTHPSFSRC